MKSMMRMQNIVGVFQRHFWTVVRIILRFPGESLFVRIYESETIYPPTSGKNRFKLSTLYSGVEISKNDGRHTWW